MDIVIQLNIIYETGSVALISELVFTFWMTFNIPVDAFSCQNMFVHGI